MASEIELEFWRLCEIVDQADTIESSVPDLEPLLLNILSFVTDNATYRDVFVKCFCELVDGSKNYSEWIILFCMRELRFVEVQKTLNERFHRLGGPDTGAGARLMNFVSDVNWVFDDSPWDSAIFFKYYWQTEHPQEPWPIESKSNKSA